MRRIVAEHALSASDLIWPVFIHAEKKDAPVPAMPGVKRLSADGLLRAAETALSLGIPALALFPAVDAAKKTTDGREAWNGRGLVPQAVRAVKKRFPGIGIITDVALDPYTSHGQDGIVKNGIVANDATIVALRKQAMVHAAAGADMVAPSDMMDGRIGQIRDALDFAKHDRTAILAYAAKYASAFYGPFRAAVGSAKSLGKADKRSYQMSPANRREALEEMRMDLAEGADMIMVKPGMPYLDVVRDAARAFDAPVLAYQVSGEYAMLLAAAEHKFLDADACMMESLLAFKRAGGRAVLTYFAPRAAALLSDKNYG